MNVKKFKEHLKKEYFKKLHQYCLFVVYRNMTRLYTVLDVSSHQPSLGAGVSLRVLQHDISLQTCWVCATLLDQLQPWAQAARLI